MEFTCSLANYKWRIMPMRPIIIITIMNSIRVIFAGQVHSLTKLSEFFFLRTFCTSFQSKQVQVIDKMFEWM